MKFKELQLLTAKMSLSKLRGDKNNAEDEHDLLKNDSKQ